MLKTTLTLTAALALSAGCAKTDSGTADTIKKLTERVEKLEASQSKIAEMDEFLAPIMAQQQAQADQKAASEPDPNARFAVDVSGNATEGPNDALVTIVEAFDFA